MNDMGDYTVHATNAEGESSTIVKLNPIGKYPFFHSGTLNLSAD